MSLLSSYEGLRQEIQRLAQENEELRRLVQLIQENHELKLVLRSRGSSLGFLAEVATSPRLPRRRTIKFKDADRGEPSPRSVRSQPRAPAPWSCAHVQREAKSGQGLWGRLWEGGSNIPDTPAERGPREVP